MVHLDRRSLLLLGLSAAAVALGKSTRVLAAQQQDLVQRGVVKKFRSMIPGVAEILVREVTYQPGGKTSRSMPHSMVCECIAGVLQVSQDAMTTTINTGEMWTCHKGMLEVVENKGTIPAVMRVIELVPA
jgi:quercetin dioxygenase-like cupin family protein